MTDTNRAYVASHFALDVGGKVIGFCRSVEGGGIKAEVLNYQVASMKRQLDTWKWSGKPKFDDITVQVGMAMSDTFWEWIRDFFQCKGERYSGAILGADFGYKERVRRTFKEALISEVQLPGVDGSDKNPCYMTVKLSPEELQYEKGTGAKIDAKPGMENPQKRWLAANFRFSIDSGDLGEGLKRVLKVDGFTIKQQILDYPSGSRRFPIKVPGRLEFPNISFYVPEVDARPFYELVKKRWTYNQPKSGEGFSGALTYLASDRTTLLTVAMFGIDILTVEPEKFEASADNIHRVKITAHVERMAFEYNKPRAIAPQG